MCEHQAHGSCSRSDTPMAAPARMVTTRRCNSRPTVWPGVLPETRHGRGRDPRARVATLGRADEATAARFLRSLWPRFDTPVAVSVRTVTTPASAPTRRSPRGPRLVLRAATRSVVVAAGAGAAGVIVGPGHGFERGDRRRVPRRTVGRRGAHRVRLGGIDLRRRPGRVVDVAVSRPTRRSSARLGPASTSRRTSHDSGRHVAVRGPVGLVAVAVVAGRPGRSTGADRPGRVGQDRRVAVPPPVGHGLYAPRRRQHRSRRPERAIVSSVGRSRQPCRSGHVASTARSPERGQSVVPTSMR